MLARKKKRSKGMSFFFAGGGGGGVCPKTFFGGGRITLFLRERRENPSFPTDFKGENIEKIDCQKRRGSLI